MKSNRSLAEIQRVRESALATVRQNRAIVPNGVAVRAVDRFSRERRLSDTATEALLVALNAVAAEDPEGARSLCTWMNLASPRNRFEDPL